MHREQRWLTERGGDRKRERERDRERQRDREKCRTVIGRKIRV